MKKFSFLLVGMLITGVGCDPSGSAPERTENRGSDAPEDSRADDPTDAEPDDHSVAGHAHGVGPHEGTIADWGGGTYHVEFTVDHEAQQATVYVLGSDERTPSPIDAKSIELSITDPEMQVTLPAAPQEGDPEGKSSRFVGTHEKLGVVQEYAGTMTGLVDGTPYSGDFKEEPHGEHEH